MLVLVGILAAATGDSTGYLTRDLRTLALERLPTCRSTSSHQPSEHHDLECDSTYALVGPFLLFGVIRRGLDDGGLAFVVGRCLLATSIAVEVALHRQHFWEDAPKLPGSLVWLTVAQMASTRPDVEPARTPP